MEGLDVLWGGILDGVSLDVAHQMVTIDARLSHDGNESVHRLEIRGVDHVEFSNAISTPWTYAELTEVHVKPLPESRLRVDIMIWSEGAGLVIDGDAMMLDGVGLELDRHDE